MMSSIQRFLPVAIIGGGPAGLTLARILQRHNVACRVYEKETGATARNQGGSLDLHEENGLWALRQCGLMDEFNRHSRPDADCMRIMDKTGAILYADDNDDDDADTHRSRNRPEIDRVQLRTLLLDSLIPGTVLWGHSLSNVETLGAAADGVPLCELNFKNGRRERAAVVIGADGAWSRVRPLLSSSVPTYTGVTFVDLTVPNVSVRHPHLRQFVGAGTAMILDDERCIIAQMNGNDTLRTYAAFKVDENWYKRDDGGAFLANVSRDAVDVLIDRFYREWNATAIELIRAAELDSVAVRRIFALPFAHTFTHNERTRLVTAVGDAAHVVGPNGEGVNLAMIDAVQLALALANVFSQATAATTTADVIDRIAAAIAESEDRMFARSKAEADAPFNFDLFMSPGAATACAQLMRRLISEAALAATT